MIKAGKTEEAEKIEAEMKQVQGQWKRQSALGRVGYFLSPVFQPLGWDWRMGTAAASFPAREVMVRLGILFDVGEGENEEEQRATLSKQLQEVEWDDGSHRKLFTLASALSVMVFFALCCQCASLWP